MNNEIVTLKNGLKTLFIDAPDRPSATTQIWFKAGSSLEEEKDFGIAHFLEHMFFRGTEKRPASQITHDAESFGGEINAFTSFDYTCYFINAPVSNIDTSIDILLDMVANPLFKEEDIVPERGVVHEEYKRSQDNPGSYAFQSIQRACFENGYAHPILGSEENILSFSQDQLLEFRNKFYNLSNTLLVVAGDLKEKEKFIKTIEQYQLPEGPESKFTEFRLNSKQTFDVHQKEVRMAQLTLSIEAPPFNSPEAPAEDLAFNCLGHGESSRLYKKLVLESSKANRSSSSTMFFSDGGAHFIRYSFPYENFASVNKAFTELVEELFINGFSEEEVDKIKNQYLASKIYEKESIESMAFSKGQSYIQTGDLDADDHLIERVKTVRRAEVNHALRNIFSKRKIHMSLQIPKSEKLAPAKKELKAFDKALKDVVKNSKPKALTSELEFSKIDGEVKVATLKPGIKLIYRRNTMAPTFVLHSYLRGGLTEEKSDTNGVHHMISSLITKGYDKRSYEVMKERFDNLSAYMNGFTGKNAYGMTMHGISDNFKELATDFLGSFMRPEFPTKWLKHEKQMAGRALEAQKEDPTRICFQEVSNQFFGAHPYSQSIIGTEESLKKITKKLISEVHYKNLQKSEIIFTFCGSLEFEEVYEFILSQIEKLSPRKTSKVKYKKVKPKKKEFTHIPFEREQTQIFHGISTAKLGEMENVYLKMLTTHLSGMSSELFVEVRDRQGLCYASQPVHFTALEGGYWGIYMASGNDKVLKAIEAIEKIIEKIKKKGISKTEFDRIKKMIEGQNLINIQTNEDYANVYSVPFLQDMGLDYFYEQNEKVKKLKHSDFTKNIKKILSRDFKTITVGQY